MDIGLIHFLSFEFEVIYSVGYLEFPLNNPITLGLQLEKSNPYTIILFFFR